MKLLKNKPLVFVIVLLLVFALIGISKLTGNVVNNQGSSNKVKLTTTGGDIVIELYPDKSPITVSNFLEYVNSGSYDGTVFHRVIEGFMIQGGGFTPEGIQKETNSPIKLESNNGLSNQIGYVAMARTNVPNSATDQFFINTKDNLFLDYSSTTDGYAVFGKVIEGMDVVYKIESSKTTTKHNMNDWPVEEIVILHAEVI